MKKFYLNILMCLSAFALCNLYADESPTTEDNTIPQTMKIKIRYNNFKTEPQHPQDWNVSDDVVQECNGIRIGEYYWMDENFNHELPVQYNGEEGTLPLTEAQLDKYRSCVFLDMEQFDQLKVNDLADFNKYFGKHYKFGQYGYCMRAKIWEVVEDEEGEETEVSYPWTDGIELGRWYLPAAQDFQQLFAMCPFIRYEEESKENRLKERDIRRALGAKIDENSMCFDMGGVGAAHKTYWHGQAEDIYGFKMMPNGARLNGTTTWKNGLNAEGEYVDESNDVGWLGEKGDIYHLFYTATFFLMEGDLVRVHDLIDTKTPSSEVKHHYNGVRYCKRIPKDQLGYELYVNEDYTDVIRIDLTGEATTRASVPAGYTVLPYGYFRGFYVQYILDKPIEDRLFTLEQIREFRVEDNYYTPPYTYKTTGIESNEADNKADAVKVFPNPVTTTAKVESTYEIGSVNVFDISGKSVGVSFSNNEIDMNNLASGIYFVKVNTEKGAHTQKVVKK